MSLLELNIWYMWWAWIALALVFGILEILAPVFIFLGLAAGAAVVGLLLALGLDFNGSVPTMWVLFAAVSLATSLLLRRYIGIAKSRTRLVRKDIND